MSESDFWKITEPYGWGTRTTDYKKIEKDLMRKLTPDEAEALRQVFGKLKGQLYKQLDRAVEGVGDDSFDDLLSHIIGMGRREYQAVMKDPSLAQARVNAPYGSKDGYKESFAYALPSKSDYARLDVSKYLKWAGKIVDATEVLVRARLEDEIDAMILGKVKPALQFLNKTLGEFVNTKDAYTLLEHEDQIKKAAEDVEKGLQRAGFDENEEVQKAGWEVNTKWATWNLLTDIRQYLMD